MSNTFIGNYAWSRGPVIIQVSWPEKSILAENTLENTKKMCLKSNIKCLELNFTRKKIDILQNLISFLEV